MTLPAYLHRIYPHLLNNLSARKTAKLTGLSHRTVQQYTQVIYEIFDVHSRKELIRRVKHG